MKLEDLKEARYEAPTKPKKPDVKKGMRISIMGKPTTVTGVGADYIKLKHDNDKSPHGDSQVVWFSDFDKYEIDLNDPDK